MKLLKWFVGGKVYPPRLRSLTYFLSCVLTILCFVAPVLAYGTGGEVLLENSEVRGIEVLQYSPLVLIAVLMPALNLAVYYLSLPQRMKLVLYGFNTVVYGVCLTVSILTAKSAMSAASAFPATFLSEGLLMPIVYVLNVWIPLFEAVLNCLDDLEKEERMVV